MRPEPLPLYPELLKFKRQPLALALTASALGLPALLWGAQHLGPVALSASAPGWLLPAHAAVALLLPYLVTLEDGLGTPRWLKTTPTHPSRVVAAKVVLVLAVALLGAAMALALGSPLPTPTQALTGLLGVLSSTLTLTVLSLLTRHFAATLVIGVVWLQLAPALLTLLPEGVRGTLGAMLPALGLTQFGDTAQLLPRLLAHALLLLVLWALLRRRAPHW
ncbi:hypothetical protein [Deinococcus multiflagellatus]|uniref:hypothetical protein n=1 Tax=Deinococcus multiflagellatus TaxID=1656887 RepID=UPI001CCF57F8|nr:hypothetical protein [Deinococcus multiflagellatus]MBZ9714330.1 hypothetical protein [Deinococcus multiflagellatus]